MRTVGLMPNSQSVSIQLCITAISLSEPITTATEVFLVAILFFLSVVLQYIFNETDDKIIIV